MRERPSILVVLLIATLGFVAATASHAAPTPGAAYGFCIRAPHECSVSPPSSIAVDQRALVVGIANLVDERLRAVSDRDQYDAADYWAISMQAGDCEDYALTKRHLMIAAGLSAGAFSLGWVKTWRDEDHMVLLVRFTDGVWVFDNLWPHFKPLESSGYKILRRSAWGDLRAWEYGI